MFQKVCNARIHLDNLESDLKAKILSKASIANSSTIGSWLVAIVNQHNYTKLDPSQAYQQLLLDEESRKIVVINTQKGLFRFTCLPVPLQLSRRPSCTRIASGITVVYPLFSNLREWQETQAD